MANLTGNERARYVQDMFARIAHRYDLMNRLMTVGQDRSWRKQVIHRARLPEYGHLLDLGAGTGDLAQEGLRQYPGILPLAADFTLEMMQRGRLHPQAQRIAWLGADALSLPFADELFDAVVSGFLFRNVSDVRRALDEQHRVLKPHGRIVILDTTRPQKNLFSPLINLHLHYVIPTLGRLVTGQGEAYSYLPESTEEFLNAEQLAARMVAAGFHHVGFVRLMLGTIAIHWGEK